MLIDHTLTVFSGNQKTFEFEFFFYLKVDENKAAAITIKIALHAAHANISQGTIPFPL